MQMFQYQDEIYAFSTFIKFAILNSFTTDVRHFGAIMIKLNCLK